MDGWIMNIKYVSSLITCTSNTLFNRFSE